MALLEGKIATLVALGLSVEPNPPEHGQRNGELAARWFGLHRFDDAWRLGFFVGARCLPGGTGPISVSARFDKIDFAEMFAVCAADPVVSRHLQHTFYVWPEEAPVTFQQAAHPWFQELLVLAYLRTLSQLCARHLRHDFARTVENLTGRVKGRIRIADQIRLNLTRQRPDRTLCEYAMFGRDTRENRVLRAALEVGAAFLVRCGHYGGGAARWTSASRAALSGVPIARITPTDFMLARTRGAFARYATPLRLARAVLQHLGLDPHSLDRSPVPIHAPPFVLCTYELFERYVEVMLRKEHEVWAGYDDANLGAFRVRPDFLYRANDRAVIVDAKYKSFAGWTAEGARTDLYKSLAYSRHKGVLNQLGDPSQTQLVIRHIYPQQGEERDTVSLDTFDVSIEAAFEPVPRLQPS